MVYNSTSVYMFSYSETLLRSYIEKDPGDQVSFCLSVQAEVFGKAYIEVNENGVLGAQSSRDCLVDCVALSRKQQPLFLLLL